MTPCQKNGNARFVWYASNNGASYRICSCIYGIRPALVFAPSPLVEYGDGEEESDGMTENDIYRAYLEYVFDWVDFENDNIGASPMSYET